MSTATPNQEPAMYTAATATSKHVSYGYDPEHPDADAEGFVTFVTLAWGLDFIATAMPGTMLPSEAETLAACEMNTVVAPQPEAAAFAAPRHPASTSDILARALVFDAERRTARG